MSMLNNRTPEAIQSDINRVKANIEQLKTHDQFTDEDRAVLGPRYQGYLETFVKELEDIKTAKNIEVNDSIRL